MQVYYSIFFISDQEQIRRTIKVCASYFFDQSYNNDNTIKTLAEKFSKYGNVIVAKSGSENVGFCAYYANDMVNYTAYLSMIILVPEARGKGISSQLLDAMIEDCKKRSMCSVELEVADSNERAIRFYQKKGFTIKNRKTDKTCIYSLKL
ncbi:MAG: GNAT family N-acetyltransferase [Ruminococcus sp.]|nr:GNAT family N-acetyltransferase [Ruminococcus sp.]